MHHATLYIAPSVDQAALPESVRIAGTDTIHAVVDAFGIAEARTLRQQASSRPVVEDKKRFLLSFATITVEAQNALLKLLEDPADTAEFHIVVKHQSMLLPTILSRVQRVASIDSEEVSALFTEFKQASVAERLALIADRTKAKDSTWLQSIFDGVLAGRELDPFVVNLFVRNFNRRGASRKMLLEYLAVTL